ncbi:MAG: hypothetical protein NC924_07760 [Candidatus Omnitrophica bacterium]|nr:hypothetical protein [Candidatus Omnitrophota bacterium]
MSKGTPYISTLPLDVLAISMTCMCILNCVMAFLFIFSIIAASFNIQVSFGKKGFDFLVVQGEKNYNGYGLSFKRGLVISKYLERNDGETIVSQIYP